jgi:hypothetical protein
LFLSCPFRVPISFIDGQSCALDARYHLRRLVKHDITHGPFLLSSDANQPGLHCACSPATQSLLVPQRPSIATCLPVPSASFHLLSIRAKADPVFISLALKQREEKQGRGSRRLPTMWQIAMGETIGTLNDVPWSAKARIRMRSVHCQFASWANGPNDRRVVNFRAKRGTREGTGSTQSRHRSQTKCQLSSRPAHSVPRSVNSLHPINMRTAECGNVFP